MKSVKEAILLRSSVRKFLDTPISQKEISDVLEWARHSPSSSNIQPWKVYVLTGKMKEKTTQAIRDSGMSPRVTSLVEPYSSRRKQNAKHYYDSLNISNRDVDAMREQIKQNFDFFGAPVGLIFTIHQDLPKSSWLDCGIFLQSIMLSFESKGIGTCAQGFFSPYTDVIRHVLQFSHEEIIICGMAVGFADKNALVNQFISDRIDVSEFATFCGFDE